MKSPFTLGNKERLKSRKLIEQLFSEGKSFSSFPFRVYYMLTVAAIPKNTNPLQAGFAVSSKLFKKAAARNRIKRLTKEAYRLQKAALATLLATNQQQMIVFFIYTGKEIPGMDIVKEKLDVILKKLLHIAHENHSSNT